MTLGPALLCLYAVDRSTPAVLKPALVIGKVPLFYFVLHLPLIHLLAIAASWYAGVKQRRRDAWLSYV